LRLFKVGSLQAAAASTSAAVALLSISWWTVTD